ncbi:MAG: response regulator, partial [Spirochaetaceae bacterium]|nr:response regulator [Spirochaetaceae bacterium]
MSTGKEEVVNPPRRRETILVVDDNPTNLAVVNDLLKGSDYHILVAMDGETILEKARLGKPDLILLDVMMPGTDGFDICRRLKADPELAEVPVIFMTALIDAASKVKGFQAGGVDYITKPFQYEETLARIRTHLDLSALRGRLKERNEQLEREVRVRKRAEAALQAAHDELERQVELRTEDLSRKNRRLRLLSGCNQALVFVEDETGLLGRICRVLGEVGGYPLAWIALGGEGGGPVLRPVVREGLAGDDECFARIVREDARGGPSSVALASGETTVATGIDAGRGWAVAAAGLGVASIAAMPIRGEAETLGVIAVYSKEGSFAAEEIELLEELADDIA